jgi:hypothetical protein
MSRFQDFKISRFSIFQDSGRVRCIFVVLCYLRWLDPLPEAYVEAVGEYDVELEGGRRVGGGWDDDLPGSSDVDAESTPARLSIDKRGTHPQHG